jgi:O-antigen biosynthesis protein
VPTVGTVIAEASEPLPGIDFGAADAWRVLLTDDGVPISYVGLADPGARPAAALVDVTLGRQIERARAASELRRALLDRLSAPAPPRDELSVSVVVCTRRRPAMLADALRALRRLDPEPTEVIVVDNDPRGEDCRAEVAEAGARYVREDRRGLNNARVTGLQAARGELIAFSDDDCLVPPTWLRRLPELFADPSVGAVTGPGIPHRLETPFQYRREQVAGFPQRIEPSRFDWTNVWAVHSGRTGTGANMILRRAAIEQLDELFPVELDAGTRTRSGGDLYALYAILAAGYRIVYDPGVYFFHRHGHDRRALLATVEGYGLGLSAFLTLALLRHREPASVAVWWWLLSRYASARADVATHQGDAELLELRRRYLAAGARGPLEWARARRAARRGRSRRRALTPRAPRQQAEPSSPRTGLAAPALTAIVVIADGDDGLVATRCVDALSAQLPDHAEVVVARQSELEAAAARGAPTLLLLDPGLDPGPGLVAAHLARQRSARGETIVIGRTTARAATRRLAALATALASADRQRLIAEASSRTLVDFDGTNLSMPRSLFERLGAFDRRFGVRAGWEFGARALGSGAEAVYESRAVATREVSPSSREFVESARREGEADARLATSLPRACASLPQRPAAGGPVARSLHAAAIVALRRPWARSAALGLMAILELIKLRRLWQRVTVLAQRGAYEQGFGRAGLRRARRLAAATTETIELASGDPIPTPAIASPRVAVTLWGRRLAEILPPGGHWHHDLLHPVLAELDPEQIRAARAGADASPVDLGDAEVILGPARGRRDDANRASIEAHGARVRTLDGGAGRRRHWEAVDAAVRASTRSIVAAPLPGAVASAEWLAEVVAAFGGTRIGVAVGGDAPHDRPSPPVALRSPDTGRVPVRIGRAPPQFIAVRREAYLRLGGYDPRAAAVGIYGPVLDLAERALQAGFVVAYSRSSDLAVAPRRRAAGRWGRAQAQAGLVTLRAAGIGGTAGLRWFLRAGLLARIRWLHRALTSNESDLVSWLAGNAAFAVGVALACVELLRADKQTGTG